jgi:hypothetical protein
MLQTTLGGMPALHPRNDFKSFLWEETNSLVLYLRNWLLRKVGLALAVLNFIELPRRTDVYERIFVATNPPEVVGRGLKKTSVCEYRRFMFFGAFQVDC